MPEPLGAPYSVEDLKAAAVPRQSLSGGISHFGPFDLGLDQQRPTERLVIGHPAEQPVWHFLQQRAVWRRPSQEELLRGGQLAGEVLGQAPVAAPQQLHDKATRGTSGQNIGEVGRRADQAGEHRGRTLTEDDRRYRQAHRRHLFEAGFGAPGALGALDGPRRPDRHGQDEVATQPPHGVTCLRRSSPRVPIAHGGPSGWLADFLVHRWHGAGASGLWSSTTGTRRAGVCLGRWLPRP